MQEPVAGRIRTESQGAHERRQEVRQGPVRTQEGGKDGPGRADRDKIAASRSVATSGPRLRQQSRSPGRRGEQVLVATRAYRDLHFFYRLPSLQDAITRLRGAALHALRGAKPDKSARRR